MTSCAAVEEPREPVSYVELCKEAGPYGEIDAFEIVGDVANRITFKAVEYTGCPHGQNVVIVTWRGKHDSVETNLARQAAKRFFDFFHAAEPVDYFEIDVQVKGDTGTLIYGFEPKINTI